MPLKAYEEFAAEPLAFPIGGKVYTPRPISAKVGIDLIRAMSGQNPALLGEDSRSLWQMVLGDVYEQMVDDDVPLDALARAGFAVLADWQNDREAAERVWESGINPEARAALAAALRENPDASTTSPHTPPPARTSSTRSRASTANTTSRQSKPRRASNGTTSSRSGR